jgi:hypothetical protein
MSRRDYLPDADHPFAEWCRHFADKIAADPGLYGLTAGDSAQLDAAFATFAGAFGTALDPRTRTRVAVAAKNDARAALEALVRSLVHRVQALPGLAADQRVALGLADRSARASRINAPATRPILAMAHAPHRSGASLWIADEDHRHRKAFPKEYACCVVFSFAGERGAPPPTDPDAWRFEGLATRVLFPLPHRPADAGRTVHFKAAWASPRGQLGPASTILSTTLAA